MSTAFPTIEDEAGPGMLAALPQIFWQRRWLIIVPAILALLAGIAAAILMPPKYQSSATILIESQQLPLDNANGSLNDAIDQRIARARERVLSRQDLIRLIRENNLYPEAQRSRPLSELVERMRAATTIEAVPIELGNGVRSMVQGSNTIALRISFDYPEATKAQIVAQQYVNNFLEVDAATQQEQATTAAGFLAEQQSQIANQINEVEAQIARIKADNGSVLAVGNTFSGNAAADAMRIDSQIAQIQADNARFASTAGGSADPAVAQAEANLRVAQARFSPTHPDVVAAKAQLDAARAAAAPSASGTNPVIAANRAQIASLQQAKAMLLSDSARARSAATQAPLIAGQIDQLTKKADILREQYRAIATRSQTADLNKRMETEQKGERLTLADPPVVPDKPYKPNRPVLVAGGLAAGLAFGLALTILFELLFHPIRGAEQLKVAAGQAPIAIIPDFERKPHFIIRYLEQRNRKRAGRGG